MSQSRHSSSARPAILYLAPLDLSRPTTGTATRVLQFVERLSAQYNVHLVYLRWPSSPDLAAAESHLPPGLASVHPVPGHSLSYFLFSRRFYRTACQVLAANSCDVIVADWEKAGWYAVWLARRFGIPFIYHSHNLEWRRHLDLARKDLRRLPLVPWTAMMERWAVRHAALVTAITEHDARVYRRWTAPARVLVIPAAFDAQRFYPAAAPPAMPPRIVFVGNLHYQPNREAVDVIRTRILPEVIARHPHAVFQMIGGYPASLASDPGLQFTGFVDDVAPYLRQASLVIVPVLRGGGMRMKTMEALACGKPVIATPVGAEGLPVQRLRGLTVVPIERFAHAINERLAQGGPAAPDDVTWLQAHYSTEAVLQPLMDRIEALSRKPRVVYLRGAYLGRFETDYLKPLLDRFHLTAITGRYNRYPLAGSPIPIQRVRSLEDFYRWLPKRLIPIPRGIISKWLGIDGVMFGLRRALAGTAIVHTAESLFFFSYQAARLKRSLGFRLVISQHEVIPFQRNHSPIVRHLRRVLRQEADLFMARTQRAKDALMLEGVPADKIRVIGHGVDTETFAPRQKDASWQQRYGLEPGQPVLLTMTRLVWEKGVHALIDAIKLIVAEPAVQALRLRCLVVGDGPQRRALQQRVASLGLEHTITFIRSVAYDQVPTMMNLADLFVLPSISTRTVSEQFGHVLAESMACGVPVVATRCGAIAEVVGEAGVLVQPNDSHDLAEALKGLLLDPARRQALGRLGLARARTLFSSDRIAAQLRQMYEELLPLHNPAIVQAPSVRMPASVEAWQAQPVGER